MLKFILALFLLDIIYGRYAVMVDGDIITFKLFNYQKKIVKINDTDYAHYNIYDMRDDSIHIGPNDGHVGYPSLPRD